MENIARWYASPAAVVQAWLAEPGHRANIEGNWSTTGIAVAVSGTGMPYWVEDFGAGDAEPPPTTTAPTATTQRLRCVVPRVTALRRDAASKRLHRAGCGVRAISVRASGVAKGRGRLAVPAPRCAARGGFSRDDRNQRGSLSARAVRELIG